MVQGHGGVQGGRGCITVWKDLITGMNLVDTQDC